MIDRQSTHSYTCWSWGPKHYECAVGRVKRDEALLRQALDALEIVHDELLQTKERIESTGIRKGYAAIIALRERLVRPGGLRYEQEKN